MREAVGKFAGVSPTRCLPVALRERGHRWRREKVLPVEHAPGGKHGAGDTGVRLQEPPAKIRCRVGVPSHLPPRLDGEGRVGRTGPRAEARGPQAESGRQIVQLQQELPREGQSRLC